MNWTGFYGGLSYGRGEVTVGAENQLGFFGGYRHEVGQGVVLGAEAEYKNGSAVDSYAVKAQFGYDGGKILPYATVGYMKADAGGLDVEDTVYGAGIDVRLSDTTFIGVEYLQADSQYDARSVAVRLGWKF